MSVPRLLVDANVLLRFLTGQPSAQAEGAKRLFQRAEEGDAILEVVPFIVAESFYTLTSFYKVDRKQAASQLLKLLRQAGLKVRDEEAVMEALDAVGTANVSFADAYLAALAALAAKEKVLVASFDRDFDKFRRGARFDPGTGKKAAG